MPRSLKKGPFVDFGSINDFKGLPLYKSDLIEI